MAGLVELFRGGVEDTDIALLALRLADSGARLPSRAECADVVSSGGPSSLSTLLCPLQLRSLDIVVPKLGIPGRPAGGIDVLGTIRGYRIHLSPREVTSVLDRWGYCHFIADEQWTPLDATLFRFRQLAGAQALAPLVIASLLAKKLAAGLTRVVLDLRVGPHGNLGADFRAARSNAERFVRIAALFGIGASCVLTDATLPYQPFIGRGEALLALHMLFEDYAPPSLRRHAALCFRMSELAAQVDGAREPTPKALFDFFKINLEAQGASLDAFADRVTVVRDSPRAPVIADRSGFVGVDLSAIRSALVDEQRPSPGLHEFLDPAGMILVAEEGREVKRGQTVAEIRSTDAGAAARLATKLASCFRILDGPLRSPRAPEVVAGG